MSKVPSPAGDAARKPSFLRSLRIVAWGFLGVRKNSAYKEDLGQANPFHVILAGLLGVLIFIVVLLLIVRWVVSGA